jgi:glyoxylase-like metal-dependent hydrolase (beta-lactamase superfamily II)
VQALGVHQDVIVFVSRFWQTTATAVRSGDEAFLIDSPVLPDELDALPAVLEQAGFAVKGLLTTHADWDHLLGRYAFAEAPLGCGESTAARLGAEPGAAQRELRDFDEEWYVERPGPLSLSALQALPVPGKCEIGDQNLELHATGGHTADGTAFFAPWAGALVVGDHLSPVEIPWISAGGSREAYLETLARLRPLVERAETVIPGHGRPQRRDAALGLLEEDAAYVEALGDRGADAPLPASRDTKAQRKIHAENVTR